MSYLDKQEMDALLNAPVTSTKQGFRDYAVLLFLYNTGARAHEAANMTVDDLDLDYSLSVKIKGKGGKTRICPLWSLTANTLRTLIADRQDSEQVFLFNCRGQTITRFTVIASLGVMLSKQATKSPQ